MTARSERVGAMETAGRDGTVGRTGAPGRAGATTGSAKAVPGVRIVLPEALRELAGGRAVVELGGGAGEGVASPGGRGDSGGRSGGSLETAGDVLGAIRVAQPGLYDRLMTEQGALRPHVNIFVDGENIRFTGGLDTAVAESSEIFVLPAISGG